MKEATIWGIHGGKTGDADSLFLKKNFVALGWAKIGQRKGVRTLCVDPLCRDPRGSRPSRRASKGS